MEMDHLLIQIDWTKHALRQCCKNIQNIRITMLSKPIENMQQLMHMIDKITENVEELESDIVTIDQDVEELEHRFNSIISSLVQSVYIMFIYTLQFNLQSFNNFCYT